MKYINFWKTWQSRIIITQLNGIQKLNREFSSDGTDGWKTFRNILHS